jgi:hypothetical protein
MSDKLSFPPPLDPPWDLILKKNAGQATTEELVILAQWLAHNKLPVADGANQIDITFEDEAAMAAWLRMQQRAKKR